MRKYRYRILVKIDKTFEVDYWGLAGVKFLNTVIAREPKKDKIKVKNFIRFKVGEGL